MAGRSERDVCQVIRAAFLAPDLVEALLQGRRPARLSVRGVMCPPTTLSGSSLFSYRSDLSSAIIRSTAFPSTDPRVAGIITR